MSGKPEQWESSNGTEGHSFIAAFCHNNCRRDANEDCQILADSFIDPVPQWVCDEDGARCTEFDDRREPPKPYRSTDPAQQELPLAAEAADGVAR